MFRHVFFAKHVERRLQQVWLTHQQLKELGNRGAMGATHLLRQRMIHFVQVSMERQEKRGERSEPAQSEPAQSEPTQIC